MARPARVPDQRAGQAAIGKPAAHDVSNGKPGAEHQQDRRKRRFAKIR